MNRFILSIDLDHDFMAVASGEKEPTLWNSLPIAVKKLNEIRSKLESEFKINIPIIWFVRADEQVEVSLGEIDYWFKKINELPLKEYDEIGLHPHVVERNEDLEWCLIKDNEKALNEVERIFKNVSKYNVKFVRFGEAYRPEGALALAEKYNYVVDSSCFSGRKSISGLWDWTSRTNDLIKTGTILEVPITTLPCKTDYDTIENPVRYCNICFDERYFNQYIEYIVGSGSLNYPIMLNSHPHEFNDDINKTSLIGIESYKTSYTNLKKLISQIDCEFINLKSLLE